MGKKGKDSEEQDPGSPKSPGKKGKKGKKGFIGDLLGGLDDESGLPQKKNMLRMEVFNSSQDRRRFLKEVKDASNRQGDSDVRPEAPASVPTDGENEAASKAPATARKRKRHFLILAGIGQVEQLISEDTPSTADASAPSSFASSFVISPDVPSELTTGAVDLQQQMVMLQQISGGATALFNPLLSTMKEALSGDKESALFRKEISRTSAVPQRTLNRQPSKEEVTLAPEPPEPFALDVGELEIGPLSCYLKQLARSKNCEQPFVSAASLIRKTFLLRCELGQSPATSDMVHAVYALQSYKLGQTILTSPLSKLSLANKSKDISKLLAEATGSTIPRSIDKGFGHFTVHLASREQFWNQYLSFRQLGRTDRERLGTELEGPVPDSPHVRASNANIDNASPHGDLQRASLFTGTLGLKDEKDEKPIGVFTSPLPSYNRKKNMPGQFGLGKRVTGSFPTMPRPGLSSSFPVAHRQIRLKKLDANAAHTQSSTTIGLGTVPPSCITSTVTLPSLEKVGLSSPKIHEQSNKSLESVPPEFQQTQVPDLPQVHVGARRVSIQSNGPPPPKTKPPWQPTPRNLRSTKRPLSPLLTTQGVAFNLSSGPKPRGLREKSTSPPPQSAESGQRCAYCVKNDLYPNCDSGNIGLIRAATIREASSTTRRSQFRGALCVSCGGSLRSDPPPKPQDTWKALPFSEMTLQPFHIELEEKESDKESDESPMVAPTLKGSDFGDTMHEASEALRDAMVPVTHKDESNDKDKDENPNEGNDAFDGLQGISDTTTGAWAFA